jgi:flagellar secretion chaperone FliS
MRGIQTYQENSVTTQTRGRLVVLLYEGAVKYLKLADKELAAGNFAAKGEYINKAVAVLTELNSCLDMDAGGEVAQNLRKLYQFMIRHLGEANVHRDASRIQDVIKCLEDLNEGWKAITR